jgi:hypothetical protein
MRNLPLHRPLAVGADGERVLPCLVRLQERPRGSLNVELPFLSWFGPFLVTSIIMLVFPSSNC